MKKFLCVLFAAMLLLTSCGKVEDNKTSITNETEEEIIITETTETEESPAEETTEEETTETVIDENVKELVLNINSFKIHYPDCYSVEIMKESNKKYVTDSVDNLIEQGFSRCGNCYPK